MLHQARRAAGRHDTAIYGVATDSNIWEFIRLGNDSKVSRDSKEMTRKP